VWRFLSKSLVGLTLTVREKPVNTFALRTKTTTRATAIAVKQSGMIIKGKTTKKLKWQKGNFLQVKKKVVLE
jgi:hypothetical protein